MLLKNFRHLFFQPEQTEDALSEAMPPNTGVDPETQGNMIVHLIEHWSKQLDVNPLATLYSLKVPLYESLLQSEILAPVRTYSPEEDIISLIALERYDQTMIPVYTGKNILSYSYDIDHQRFSWMPFVRIAELAVQQNVHSVNLNPDGPIPISIPLEELAALATGKLPPPPKQSHLPGPVAYTSDGLQFLAALQTPLPAEFLEALSQYCAQHRDRIEHAYLFDMRPADPDSPAKPTFGIQVFPGHETAFTVTIQPDVSRIAQDHAFASIGYVLLNAEPNLHTMLDTFTQPFFKASN